ncbi:MAG: SRPBCC family protein [Burkholderiales bacterium]|nr:SRPBCC family protein [Burkholderiales bacterium]
MKITVETTIAAPLQKVWSAWITPADIVQWNAASDDWHTPSARVDLRVGGDFSWRMEARDGSMGFDFEGVYTAVEPEKLIAYRMADGREVTVEFIPSGSDARVRETFDAETMHSPEQQREGWQAILDRFARHVSGG